MLASLKFVENIDRTISHEFSFEHGRLVVDKNGVVNEYHANDGAPLYCDVVRVDLTKFSGKESDISQLGYWRICGQYISS